MNQYNNEYYSRFSIEQIYSLITEIEEYPKFLPWCSNALLIEETEEWMIADLTIKFSMFVEHYRSKITLTPPQDKFAKVDVQMISGPFKYLTNHWILEEKESGTLIKFNIEFEFKSVMLEKLIGIVFTKAAKKMMEAFMQRAEELYGNQ